MTAAKPTGPPPTMAMEDPGGASGTSTFTTLRARTTARVAKLDCPKKCDEIGPSPLDSALEPSSRRMPA